MGSFSFWHWLIVLLILGGIAYAVFSARKKSPASEPVGFGGWLILPMIGQTLAPLQTLVTIANNMKLYDQIMAVPGGAVAFYGENALTLAFLILQIIAIIAMYSKNRLFPKLFLYQWLAILVYGVLDALLVSAALGVPVNGLYGAKEISSIVGPFLGTGLWVLYMYKSVRVRNTFVRGASLDHGVAEHH